MFHTKKEIRYFARPFLVLMSISLTIAIVFFGYCALHREPFTIFNICVDVDNEDGGLGLGVSVIVMLTCWVFWIFVFWRELLEKLFAKIKIVDDTIIWKCIFRRKHTMRIQDCRFIGVELENSFNQLDYPYIYFTKVRYPKEYEHKINELKNTDDFIKFWYTEELAEYLLTHFPKERTGSLQSYRFSHEKKSKKRSASPKNKKRKKK